MLDLKNFPWRLRRWASWLQTRRARGSIARANAARDRQDWLVAATAYDDALTLLPENAGLWGQLGNVLKDSRQFERAESAYRQCLRLATNDTSDTWLQLGHLYKVQDRTREAEYAYLRSLQYDPSRIYAFHELLQLGWSVAEIISVLPQDFEAEPSRESHAEDEKSNDWVIAIDVSDLFSFLLNSRRPTGIQRVSISLIRTWVMSPPQGVRLCFVSLMAGDSEWRSVPAALLSKVCERLVAAPSDSLKDMQLHIVKLLHATNTGPALRLHSKTTIVSLGSPAGLANYHLHIRNAQERAGVKYCQFVHDCIPLIMPQYFVEEHVPEFLDAMLQTLSSADAFLVNSTATAKDLLSVAAQVGHDIVAPTVIRLDGPLFPTEVARPETTSSAVKEITDSSHSYVLFVSTIEPRKNHLLAFQVWANLLRERGPSTVPRLVCVGQWGWKFDAVKDFIVQHAELDGHLVILSSPTDTELAQLYSASSFVIYPSSYEGWGLPVAEALQYGKLPLVARTSSLPEVGGDFAEYFDLDVVSDFAAKLRRLIDDRDYLSTKEAKIKSSYSPRAWTEIGEQIIDAVKKATQLPAPHRAPQQIEPGVVYSLAKEGRHSVAAGPMSGHSYRYGVWGPPSDTGCRLTAAGRGELRLSLPGLAGPTSILLKVKSSETLCEHPPTKLRIEFSEVIVWQGTLEAGETRWLCLPLLTAPYTELRIAFSIAPSEIGNPATETASTPQPNVCGFLCLHDNDEGVLADSLRSLIASRFLEVNTGLPPSTS